MPGKIEALEREQIELHERMGEANFYRQGSDKITATMNRIETVKIELETCYQRWQTLESIAPSAEK